ncbi:MAG TPA: BMP family ABC transporter substrate-binding protein, partial [Actinomycetota bacterium]|nr:BMP family ABC transporter substrate-binding protein [Actinomycetota bacterium]
FNDAAKRGLDMAIDEGLVSDADCIEPNATGSNRDDNVVNLADQEYELVAGIGFAFSEGIAKIAPDYPEQYFAVIDGFATTIATDATNIVDLAFKEHEGSFLVGAAAAMASESGTIGFLGGQRGTGLIEKFEAGYEAGAREINPDIEILVEYIGDDVTAFNDPTKGEALSQKMYDQGADVVYHAAGASGAGLFQAAVAADALAIGVDSDQYLTASPEQQPHILTSMLKRVDTAIHDVIADVKNGTFEPGFKVFGMAEEGVDYSQSNTELMTPEMIQRLDEYKQQIIDGTITVPEEPQG